MLPKACLTSLSRMSGSKWVTTPLRLSRSFIPFLYSFSVYFCNFFLTFSASVRSLPFLSFIVPIFAWNAPLVSSVFLKKSLVFPILLFSCIPLYCSLKKAFLFLLAILWNSAFSWLYLSLSPLPYASLLFSAICKISLDNHFSFLHFFFFGIVLVITSCTILQTSIHSSSGTLPSRPNLIGHHVNSVQSYQACSKREMRRNISYTEIWYKKKKKKNYERCTFEKNASSIWSVFVTELFELQV